MRHKRVFRSWVVAFLVVCAAAPSFAKGRVEKNKDLARRVFEEILNQGKYEIFDEIYTRDFVKHVDRKEFTLAQEKGAARAMRDASSDLVMTIDQMVAEGDQVAILYTGRGTSTGPFGGMPATGKKYVVSGVTLYRFSGGKIAEEWTFYNMLDILNQLGYPPGPPAK